MSWGFINTSSGTLLFVRRNKAYIIIVLIYVDDILITGPNTTELEGFITEFSRDLCSKRSQNLCSKRSGSVILFSWN